jgi:uncharacterized membrane protein YfcA
VRLAPQTGVLDAWLARPTRLITGLETGSALAALGVGLLIGMAGVGGVLLAPWLTLAQGLSVHQAMAVAMIAFMGPGLLSLWRARQIKGFFKGTRWLVLATLPGALLGSWLLQRIPNAWALWILAGVVFATGVHLLRGERQHPVKDSSRTQAQVSQPGQEHPSSSETDLRVGAWSGFAIGLCSALTVTGGPLLLIPLLLWRGARLAQAIALGQLVQMPISGGATLANAWTGSLPWASGLMYGALMLPAAWLGMHLAPRVPRVALSRLVAGLMLVSAAAAAWKATT